MSTSPPLRNRLIFLLFLRLTAITTGCHGLSLPKSNHSGSSSFHSSRRKWISQQVGATTTLLGIAQIIVGNNNNPSSYASAAEVEELPKELRKFTALAPLGGDAATATKAIENKLNGLSLEGIATKLSHDLVDGSTGKGGYFISGDISTEIFRDDCEFTDPTNSVSSLRKYQKALTILFNPEQSFVELVEPLKVDATEREITGRIRSGGTLLLPWNPKISPYESTIKWKVDQDGLIESQIQKWSIPASQALRETFTPSNF